MNKKNKFVGLTDDKMFRYVFSHNDLAEWMINLYLDYMGKKEKVKVMTSTSDYCIMGDNIFAKEGYSDAVAFLENGEKYSLEMYTSFGKEEFIKTFIYLTRILLEGLKSGDDYKSLKKVTGLCFMTGNYRKNNKLFINTKAFVDVLNPNLNVDNYLELALIRLDKVDKLEYTKSKHGFIRLLKLINAKSFEDVEKMKGEDEHMDQTIRTMYSYLTNPGVSSAYEKELKKIRLAKEEGVEQGIMKTAKNMLEYGVPLSAIVATTGLTEEEIKNLKVKE